MKKLLCIIVVCSLLTGCGQNKEIKGKVYGTYGLINSNEMKNPDIEYRLIIGNLIWSCLLVETIIAPIYFIGFSLYEPVGSKTNFEKGVLN